MNYIQPNHPQNPYFKAKNSSRLLRSRKHSYTLLVVVVVEV